MNELLDFYDRYMAAFNARDAVSFAGFFHLPVTVFSLPTADQRTALRPPKIVTTAAELWPTLPASWTRSTVDEIRVVGDTSAYTPRDTLSERTARRPALEVTVTRWADEEPYQQMHVLYLLASEAGRLGIIAMVSLAMAVEPKASDATTARGGVASKQNGESMS